ncbi:MAG: four helix bundle protein [Burkholderiales bacterium]|jgi:four helix bundle protein|nr:four helix bundle protein [Burkholderiales bacterium]
MKYRDLKVWQKAMDLTDAVYLTTGRFPSNEQFGLCSQLRRAAVSVPSNIAEGHGRKYTNAYMNHLSIAFGSLMEVETLIAISLRQNYLDQALADALLARTNEIGKMLSGLQKSLKIKVDDPL